MDVPKKDSRAAYTEANPKQSTSKKASKKETHGNTFQDSKYASAGYKGAK